MFKELADKAARGPCECVHGAVAVPWPQLLLTEAPAIPRAVRTLAVPCLILVAACFDPLESGAGTETASSTGAESVAGTTPATETTLVPTTSVSAGTEPTSPNAVTTRPDAESTSSSHESSESSTVAESSTGEEGETRDASTTGDSPATWNEEVCEAPSMTCGGACIEIASDPEHCGRCDRSCFGEACTEGRCAPVRVATLERPIVDLSLLGPYLYVLDASGETGSSVLALPTDGGSVTTVGWTWFTLERLITDASYHYSYYFDASNLIVGRSLLFDTQDGNPTFAALHDPRVFPSPIPLFESSDQYLYIGWSAESLDLYRVDKAGGELEWVEGASGFRLRDIGIVADDAYVYGIGASRTNVLRLPAAGGNAVPMAAARVDETFSAITGTEASLLVASNQRVAQIFKDETELTTLADIAPVYRLEGDRDGSSVVFVQARGDAETCSEGSALYESDDAGVPSEVAVLRAGCVSHLVFDEQAIYWVTEDGLEVFKVSRP